MQKDSKFVIEQCYAEKFIAIFNNEMKVIKREAPDFILELNNERIGLEVERIFITKPENRGFIESIFDKAEERLREKYPDIKNLLNFSVDESKFPFEVKMKETTITKIVECAYNAITNNAAPYPDFIKRLSVSNHTDIKLHPNLGAYWLKQLNSKTVIAYINKKEKLIQSYKSNTQLKTQWLLLVVSGIHSESDYSDIEKDSFNIQSQFDKVFLLNDFQAKIFHLK
jgi:hypothetical protein